MKILQILENDHEKIINTYHKAIISYNIPSECFADDRVFRIQYLILFIKQNLGHHVIT